MSSICLAQSTDFKYKPDRPDSLETFITNANVNKVKNFDPKLQKKVKELLLERKTAMIEDVNDSLFIFDKTINRSLNKILTEIYRANPQIAHKDFYFFINKSMIPNATCYGNGIFSVNLGLFTLIETDDELASVISHEMAHHLLKHTDKSMTQYLGTLKDREVRKRFNRAANQKYGRRAAITALMKDLQFNFMHRSRQAETEADSLGYQLFAKTKYNKQAFVDVLKKLDFSDDLFFNENTNLKKHFSFDGYPFKDAWLTDDGSLFEAVAETEAEVAERDSLKTHPDIPLRVSRIEKLYPIKVSASSSEVSKILQQKAATNGVKVFFDDYRLDFALYAILSQYEKGDMDDKTYSSLLARLLKQTYTLKERHLFGKYVSPVNRLSEEKNINEIRLFLNNLELKNIRKIGYNFCVKQETVAKGDTDFDQAYDFFKNLNQNKN
jgi:Zn-dependent protease with chaperone function